MQEIWKDIEGYEGCYQVSNLGRVKSLMYGKEKILKAQVVTNGYLAVSLCKEGKIKKHTIHRLVAKAFIENPDNLPQVNHRDENKTNNTIQNLEWCSAEYNMNYGNRNKRSVESNTNNPKKSKQVLCVETNKIYPSVMQVKREFGFSNSNISKVCLGKIKSAYGYTWRYI